MFNPLKRKRKAIESAMENAQRHLDNAVRILNSIEPLLDNR